tara:strand:- start:40 stop:1272 length:1233 start_codon:yes stop_codon:yes gene_type:complete
LFTKAERLISFRNLKPKKKEGFLKVISAFSFLGIMLGVAILIIVMSVMNGFRTDLTNKILGFNPHIVIQPYEKSIDETFKNNLKKKYSDLKFSDSYNGEAVVMTNDVVKGILIKGIKPGKLENYKFIKEKLIEGSFDDFKENNIILGKELAITLELKIGDQISLMSSAFVGTPLGTLPKQQTFSVAGIFNSGFYEFDHNVVFLNLKDSLTFFEKTKNDINLDITLNDPLKADFFKEEIEKINKNFYIYSWTDLNRSFFDALKVERNVMFIILTLIIIVAAFNIISGLNILIKNKTKEIAILRTLGLSKLSITKSFFLTGFTIGFFASITGVVLGVAFSFYIEEIRLFISMLFNVEIFPAEIYFLDKMPSEINLFSITSIFLFSLVVSAIASLIPAMVISKMEITKALKYE